MFRLLVTILAGAIAAAGKLDDVADDQIVKLVTDHDSLVLFLYNPDCERCKPIEENLTRVNDSIRWEDYGLEDVEKDVAFRKLNVRQYPGIERMVQGAGVPSLLLVKGPWINEYTGRVTNEEFGPWVAKHVGPLWAKYLKSDKEMKSFLSQHDVAIVLESTEEGRKMFEMAAGSEREFATYAWREWVPTGKNSTGQLTVQKYGMSEPIRTELDVSNARKVYEAVVKIQLPLLTVATPNNIQEFLREPRPIIWFVCNTKAQYERYKKVVKPLLDPRHFKKQFYWMALIGEKERTAREFAAATLQVPKSQEAAIVVSDVSETGRWIMEDLKKTSDLSKGSIEKFIKGIEDQTLEKYYNSQEPISAAGRYPLNTKAYRVVAAKELEELLLNEKAQDTLLILTDPVSCKAKECKILTKWAERFALEINPSNVACVRVLDMASIPLNELDSTWKFPMAHAVTAGYIVQRNVDGKAKSVSELKKELLEFESEEELEKAVANGLSCDVTDIIERLQKGLGTSFNSDEL